MGPHWLGLQEKDLEAGGIVVTVRNVGFDELHCRVTSRTAA
jgi:hypothetical protein